MKPPPQWLMIIGLAGALSQVFFGTVLEFRLICAVAAGILFRSLIANDRRPTP